MASLRTIDTHTHVLTEGTMALLNKETPKAAIKLTPIDNDFSTLEVAGVAYKPFPRGGFDIERRLKDMDATGVDVHVLSATPQTYLYGLGTLAAAIQNDGIAKLVKQKPDRFMGIGTLPMQNCEEAATELRRIVKTLGLKGAMFASNVQGKNLDDPGFDPLWKAAEELGAFMFIHPNNVAGADRLKSYYLANLIGNPLDTTIAAACMVFGGVFDRFPKLKVCLAHGGGFTPYQAARWTHGWDVRPEPKKNVSKRPEQIVEHFIYDTILHSKETLEFMIQRVGTSRVVLGSDYPYDMGMMDCVAHVKSLAISDKDKQSILHDRAIELLTVKG
ncbi:MAG: amidohydrolase family protein [Pseudolabrys sp.]|nr:amidohydrolase family protein [Pseudolabrys sp.]